MYNVFVDFVDPKLRKFLIFFFQFQTNVEVWFFVSFGWQDLCLYVGYTSSVHCTASVLTLAAIAFDRYQSIMDCLRYSSRCTLRRTSVVVLWIWLQALITSCPPLLGWSSVTYVVPMYNCAINWASSSSYTALMVTLSYLIPALVILFCYVNIMKVARSHARRIHTLEDSVQRSRDPCVSAQQHCQRLNGPSQLVYHVSGQFVSDISQIPAQNQPTSRHLVSFLAHGTSQPPPQNNQQHHNHHGVVRLLLVIMAFFVCWTPYIGVALISASESAVSGQSSLVPPYAVTLSYWLMLLNSDINPFLYALLSKRFQAPLQALRQKIRAQLRRAMGRAEEVMADGDEGRVSDLCTSNTTHSTSPCSSESAKCDVCKYSTSVYTVSTDLNQLSGNHVCNVCHAAYASSSSVWSDPGGDRTACLQVPSLPQEGNRLPFSALTSERQATFFYGQITVIVEHDVC